MAQINYATMRFNPQDGYGLWAVRQVQELSKLGLDVSPYTYDMITDLGEPLPAPINVHLYPANHIRKHAGKNVAYTMWEDDVIPDGWVDAINDHADMLVTPCAFYSDLFKRYGVNVPIETVGGGVDSDTPLLPVRDDRPFTFMCLADRGIRKGLEVVINAWRKGFAGLDARLIVKVGASGHDFAVLTWLDNRIEILRENIPSMTDVFALADCYVYPSYGDGWGLTPRQAVAHGIPVIAPRHTGLSVGIDAWATQVLETFDRPLSFYGSPSARWFKPQIEETLSAMLWVYHNRDKAREKALQGRKWLLDNQTWRHSAISLAEVLGCI